MTGSRHHSRLPWVVLAAIVGMLSMVGQASACTTAKPVNVTRACCAASPSPECGCCDMASAASRPESAGRSVAIPPGEAGLAAPDRPCECRSSDPATPASKSESRSTEDRSDHDRGDSVGLTLDTRPAITFDRLILPTASPPKAPLYLRTSRLLI